MMSLYLFAQIWIICLVNPSCKGFKSSELKANAVGCQHKSTSGRDYRGAANTTSSGVSCQKWSNTQALDHPFTSVGDHNYCRNPFGTALKSNVWCLTSVGFQPCSVPYCPPLKVLDFSLDNDMLPDPNNTYTHASLQKMNLPSSFTICAAFMVERWELSMNSPLFLLLDSKNKTWLDVEIFSARSNAEFIVIFSDGGFTAHSPSLFFPMKWTRICFSFNSNTSIATLVVDGKRLIEKAFAVKSKPLNLDLVLGKDKYFESPGMLTDVNIFSTSLSNMERMTEAGTETCGSAGDFLNWEEADWTLHSKARVIEMDSAKGPCRRESKMHVYPMTEAHQHSDCMQHCKKLGGRSPPVTTYEEWKMFSEEVQILKSNCLGFWGNSGYQQQRETRASS